MTSPPDLTSLVLTLAPSEPLTMPAHLGRASYALLMRLIDAHDPTLAQTLHDTDGRKPFTCSTLIGGRRTAKRQRTYTPDQPAWLRFTGLTAAVSAHLLRLADHPPAAVELDGRHFTLLSATLDPAVHPWANATTYDTLASPYLLAKHPPDFRISLNFASPTAFRQKGISHPVPMGNWVFGSLVDRWNQFSPVQIPPETRRYADECVVLSYYRLHTRAVPLKEGLTQMGCVGLGRYALLNKDRFWASLLNLLSYYAFYSGVGYQTTVGLGQTIRYAEDDADTARDKTKS